MHAAMTEPRASASVLDQCNHTQSTDITTMNTKTYYSRAIDSPIADVMINMDWTMCETLIAFHRKSCFNPALATIVSDIGNGTVWQEANSLSYFDNFDKIHHNSTNYSVQFLHTSPNPTVSQHPADLHNSAQIRPIPDGPGVRHFTKSPCCGTFGAMICLRRELPRFA